MTGIFAPDCDCDGAATIGMYQVVQRHFKTDREAVDHYASLTPDQIGQQAIHGPSGHLLALRR